MAMVVYRVQDEEGRGPFKPGVSCIWADKLLSTGMKNLPTWMDEFGPDLIARKGRIGEHFGTGVRKITDISKWFSLSEQKRLDKMGYKICAVRVGRILAESKNQMVFASMIPFKDSLVCKWSWE